MTETTSLWVIVFILLIACIAQEISNSRKHENVKKQLIEQGLIKDGGKHGHK